MRDNTEQKEIIFERVSLKEKLSYGFANMPGTFYSAVMGVIQAFYYGWMGLFQFIIL